jgi:hypothetical protein
MLSKLISKARFNQQYVNLSTRAFRATTVLDKKPSIGDAVTILQSKVSSINQVVSIYIALHVNLIDSVSQSNIYL